MNAFEESLLAVIEQRVKRALASLRLRDAVVMSDPVEAQRALGDAHAAVMQIGEDVRCLRRLHEMADDMEREAAE